MVTEKSKRDNVFNRMYLRHRFYVGLVMALLALVIVWGFDLDWIIKVMIVWNTFVFVTVVTSWQAIITRSTEQIRLRAREEDSSKTAIVSIILFSCFASLVGVLLLVLSTKQIKSEGLVYIPAAILGILLSWIMVH